MKNGEDGLICPWCPGKKPINKCAHNPFKLMEEVERLKAQVPLRLVKTLRDEFAMAALPGRNAKEAYEIADEMLRVR